MKEQNIAPTISMVIGAVLLLPLPFLFGGVGTVGDAGADVANGPSGSSATSDPDFEQCRVDAVMAYMQAQGFEDGDFVIGEDNIDTSMPEFSKTGSLGFGKDGMIVDSRTALQGVFDSSDENLQAVANAQTNKFPQLDEEVILDAENWEIVQSTIPVQIQGNTGFSNGTVVDMGLRNSAAGDAGWLFIDTELCTVPTASHTAAGELVSSTTPDKEKPVGFIRVGCINPGDGFLPPPPPPPPPTNPPPPPPCPPGQVKNENGVCVVPKSSNPDDYRQPGDGGKGQDVGTGTKPPAPAPTTPPESTPPPVNTSQPGGGGVVDSPTNPPGSETGVTAPGATPPPTTAPAPPPPNEGGDNGEGEVVPEPNW